MTKKATTRALLTFAAMSMLVSLALSAGTAGAQTRKHARIPLTILATPSLNFMALYAAVDEGFFKKHGLDVTVEGGIAGITPILTGDYALAAGSEASVLSANAQGAELRNMVMLAQVSAGHAICRSDLGLNANAKWPNNLIGLPKGSVIGVAALVGSQVVLANQVWAGAGLKQGSDYTLLSLGSAANLVAALEAKRIACAQLFAPYSWQEIQKGVAIDIVDVARGEGPKALQDVYGASILAKFDWIKAHPGVAKAIVAAELGAIKWMHNPKNVNAMVQLGIKYTGVNDVNAIKAALPGVIRLSSPSFNCTKEAREQKLLAAAGQLPVTVACYRQVVPGLTPGVPLPKKKK
jgi:NitT/TauT family transport system substrate-binding protein